MEILHFLLVGIHTLLHGVATDGLEGGIVDHAGHRVLPARRREAVDHQVDLAQVGLDGVDGLLLDLVAEGVAIDTPGVQTVLLCIFVESGRVIPTGSTWFFLRALFFKEHAEGIGPTAKGGGNPGSQAVAGGGADHQHPLGAILNRSPALYIVNLLFDIGSATDGVCGNAEESANAWLDDHWHVNPERLVNAGLWQSHWHPKCTGKFSIGFVAMSKTRYRG